MNGFVSAQGPADQVRDYNAHACSGRHAAACDEQRLADFSIQINELIKVSINVCEGSLAERTMACTSSIQRRSRRRPDLVPVLAEILMLTL